MLQPCLSEAFETQAVACQRLGAPFTTALGRAPSDCVGPGTAREARLWIWPGDPVANALALRLCAPLHRRVRSARARGLVVLYPTRTETGSPLAAALRRAPWIGDADTAAGLDHPPQTNEVGRSGCLIDGPRILARETGLAVALREIGSAAGLDLLLDRLAYDFGPGTVVDASERPEAPACAWKGPAPAPGPSRAISTGPCSPKTFAGRHWEALSCQCSDHGEYIG